MIPPTNFHEVLLLSLKSSFYWFIEHEQSAIGWRALQDDVLVIQPSLSDKPSQYCNRHLFPLISKTLRTLHTSDSFLPVSSFFF